MYLKSLELSGFKSFAKKTTLEFGAPITSVVGPNGSGKSNVAEAFRFVLGEQSIKSMRGKRTEDLIWNGGGDVARANRASVKVVFDNRQKILNVDFDEVTIERTIYRDSSSEYLINGTLVRLKDIIELLAGAHIGSSGHHIISQGEADKILNANSRERRDILEDALGLKIYQYKRAESEKKLEKTEENMKSVESLRREIVPHIKFLKKQVEKIEHTLELKEKLRTLCKEYFKREDIYIRHTFEVIEKEKLQPTLDFRRLEQELLNAKKILEQSALRDVKSNEIIELESELVLARTQKDTIVRELGRIEGAIQSEERIIRREKDLAYQEENKSIPLKEFQNVSQVIDERIKQLETRRDEGSIMAFFAFIRSTFSEFTNRYKNSSEGSQLAQSEEEILRLKNLRDDFDKKLKICDEKEIDINQLLRTLQTNIEKEKDSSRAAERDVFRIMSEQNTVRGILSDISHKDGNLKLISEDLKREMHESAMLLGRSVLDFDTQQTNGQNGQVITPEIVIHEDRVKQDERKRLIQKSRIRIEDSGSSGGNDVIKEFQEATERDAFLEKELADLHNSADSLKKLISELEERLANEFNEGVKKINIQFGNFFTLMFGGGQAKLEVVREVKKRKSAMDLGMIEDVSISEIETNNPEEVSEGIEIEVSLPRKKIKDLMMLSGGERALTSIALLFAISQVNPPPFVVLDETDAALDEANSKKYGDMIENLAKLSQLILITHNRETMSRAGVLYGLTMGSGGGSKLLSIAFDEAIAVAK